MYNWKQKKLIEVCDKISLNKIKIKQKDYLFEGKYPVIDQGQELIGGYYNNEDLLVPNDPPYIIFGDHTKVKKFIPFRFIAGADGVKVLKAKNNILPKFLYYLLHTIKIENKGYARHFQLLEKETFLFPENLPEQRAIVKKLESLFSSLDAGVADLKKAQQQLKIYRQAVLRKAFDGEMNSKKLGEIAEITSSRRIFKDEYVTSGIPFYRTKEIKELSQGLKPAVELFIPISRYEEIKKNNDLPKTNDILISAVGTIGVSYVIRDNEPFYFKDGNLVWIKNPQINSYFLHYFFENKVRFSNSIDTSGSAYNALTIEKLKNFNITFPENITEQELIVKQIESRLSVCDSIEQNIKESLVKAEALRQSILKKAFEGNLLTAQELAECKQAADYEPASVLLERIKKENKKK